jgi:hypothetical protein
MHELPALWQFERDTNKVLQESLDEREADLEQCVDELARLEAYHAYVNDVLLSAGDCDALNANSDVSSSFTVPEIVIDDPFLMCNAAERLVLEAVAGRRAHLYLLDTVADNNGRVYLLSWVVDEDGQRKVVRVPVGERREDDEQDPEEALAAHALVCALQEEEPLLPGGGSLVARVVDRAGLVLGVVEIIKRQRPLGSQGERDGLFTPADLAALGNVQDQLASTLLLLRLLQRRRRLQDNLVAAAAHNKNHTINNSNDSSRTSSPQRMRGSRALTYTAAAAAATATGADMSTTSCPTLSNGHMPVSPFCKVTARGREVIIREEEEKAAIAGATAATRQLQLQQQHEEEEGLKEKYTKAKIYIRRLEKELRRKVRKQERALLAQEASEGAKRIFGKVEEMEALIAELSTRQEQLRYENDALATAKGQTEAAANAAAIHAEAKTRMEIETLAKSKARVEVELRARIHQLEREKEAVKAKVARLKAEVNASEWDREQLRHDLRRCHKKLEKSQNAVKQARVYQEITQAELWDLKESLQRMEAGTNDLRQQLLCQEGQEEGGRTRFL